MKVLIVGGGLGGLTLGLSLHHRGIEDVDIFEASDEIRELGVGMNVQPAATEILARLGLQSVLASIGAPITRVVYLTRLGQEVWSEPRGRAAGLPGHQLGVHRGRLITAMLGALRERLGTDRIHTGHRVSGVESGRDGVELRFSPSPDGTATGSVGGDVIVGADGAWSTVRAAVLPEAGSPRWNGVTMWRGIGPGPELLDARTMAVVGHSGLRFRVHPIGGAALSWVAERRETEWTPEPRPDWGREGDFGDTIEAFSGFRFAWLDAPALMHRAEAMFEYPMVDHDPLPRWSRGRLTLLGDAAHSAFPVGSSGGSQAVVDAWVLAEELARSGDVAAGLRAYEVRRRPQTERIVELSRRAGPLRCLDLAEERAPEGFDSIDEVFAPGELETIAREFALAAGQVPPQV